jgi:chromosome segregation ATPase
MSDVNQNPAITDDADDEAISLFAQMHEAKDSNDSKANAGNADASEGDTDESSDDDDQTSNSQGQTEEDPWATVPEQLRNEYLATKQRAQQFESQFNASQHRLAPTQRELEAVRKQLAEIEKQKGAKGSDDSVPTAADLKGKTFAELQEEWPEVAAALVESQSQTQQLIQRELEPLRQMRQQQEQAQQEQFIQSELSRLAKLHPDFQQVAADPAFTQWVNQQPPGVKAMYGSVSADDNAALITLFKTSTGRTSKPVQKKNSLSDHAVIPRQGPGRAAVDPNSIDPAELFVRLNANKK